MQERLKYWDQLIEELTVGVDLSGEDGKDTAYKKCVSYAETNMAGDLWCNAFLAHAATRLGTTQVMRDVVSEIVAMPQFAQVHVAFDPQEGAVITSNREGINYLSELLRVLAGAPTMGEHVHLYWDEAPLSGETYGLVAYLEDDAWFEKYAQDYYSVMEEERVAARRNLTADRVMAIQIQVPLACSLDLKPKKVYLVQETVKICGDEVWTKPIRDDDSRIWIFSITDDNHTTIQVGLDLDDPEILFLTREELEQFLQ